jgi:putative glycosyltransferase (TIGR04348 family)
MKIGIITPAPPKSRYGNRVTALRWARILRSLGHSISIKQKYDGQSFDLLIALHARRSHASIKRFARDHPNKPMVVALTGTDLYRDLGRSPQAQTSLDLATRIVVLQPKAVEELRANLREKTRLIYQSVDDERFSATDSKARLARSRSSTSARRTFDVCVIGHLRPVKDPFRAAMASRLLPSSSRIRILHVGAAMTGREEDRARAEMRRNPRYQWLGEQPAWRVRRILKQSRLCVLSSKMEGGANALGEAIVAATPVLSSRIPGSIGILGEDYAGYFEVGDTGELARLMIHAECDPTSYAQLVAHCRQLIPLFDPAREKAAWAKLLDELYFSGTIARSIG